MYDLMHTGVAHDANPPGRGSGRYEFGSGENPEQHQEKNFLNEVKALKAQGYTEKEIARTLIGQKGVDKKGNPIWATSTDLRARMRRTP